MPLSTPLPSRGSRHRQASTERHASLLQTGLLAPLVDGTPITRPPPAPHNLPRIWRTRQRQSQMPPLSHRVYVARASIGCAARRMRYPRQLRVPQRYFHKLPGPRLRRHALQEFQGRAVAARFPSAEHHPSISRSIRPLPLLRLFGWRAGLRLYLGLSLWLRTGRLVFDMPTFGANLLILTRPWTLEDGFCITQ